MASEPGHFQQEMGAGWELHPAPSLPASVPSSPAHPRQPAASRRAKPPRCRDAGERKQNPTWRWWRGRRAGPGSQGRGGSRRAPGGWRWGPAVLAAPSCSAGLLRKKQRALATDFKIHEKCFVWLLLPWFCFKVVHCTEAAASSQLCWGCPQQGAVWWAQPCLRGGCDDPSIWAGARNPCTHTRASAHPAQPVLPRLGCRVGTQFQIPLEALGPLVPLGRHGFDTLRIKAPCPATGV